jgi:hypothetical protein
MTPAEQDDDFRRHLKHRMTALLSPLVIGDGNNPAVVHWRGQQDVYKAALDGSGVTLRLFIEFTGVPVGPEWDKTPAHLEQARQAHAG